MNGVNGNKGGIVGIILQAGGVGLALVAMWMLWNIVGNHMTENTDAWNNNTAALTEFKGSIENLNNTIQATANEQVDAFDGLKNAILQLRIR